ncbi:MAG: hypothetical protein JO013_07105, partial [Alphaproteobacteria bacterium]|nr:hypothetical protein [Alphaproteobacteria bacterium]
MFAVRDVITSNFAIVVAVQAIWFACVTAWTSSWAAAWRHLAVGMVVGLPTGVAFDLIIGSGGGIFRYVGVTSSASFTIINGVFSYGLAAATVLAPPSAKLPNYEGGNRRGVLAFCCCAIGVLIALTVERWHTLLLT